MSFEDSREVAGDAADRCELVLRPRVGMKQFASVPHVVALGMCDALSDCAIAWPHGIADAETGELYYYYLSRECLTNRKNYAPPEQTRAEQIAELLATENGWTLRYLAAEEDGSAAAVYSTPGGTLCFAISCRVYDALIDIKLACR